MSDPDSSVGELVWRDVQRLRQDMIAVENALECDAYRPEMKAAARALLKLGTTAGRLGDKIRNSTPLPERSAAPSRGEAYRDCA
jgi:hypothetical protein